MKSSLATLILRVPSSLHQRLKQEARWADRSLNKHCLALLSGRETGSSARGSPPSLSLAVGASRQSEVLKELSARALETLGNEIQGLVLFGSFARGRETANSDIDLLVVVTGSVPLDRDVYSRWQLGKCSGREVAPLFVHIPAEGERIGGLWFEAAFDGIVLFDRDLRLSRFFSQVRNLVASGRVRRMMTHGHPYWVHCGQVARNLASERD